MTAIKSLKLRLSNDSKKKEDDDFLFRLLLLGLICFYDTAGVFRDLPNPAHQQVQRGRTLPPHVRDNRKRRSQLFRGLVHSASDGLSTLSYSIVDRAVMERCEKIRVRWNDPPR